MKRIPTYSEFLNEAKTTDFKRTYAVEPAWWELWKAQSEKEYDIQPEDAFTKTIEVKKKGKDGETIFIFDYQRNKIFTNEDPSIINIKEPVAPEDLKKAQDKGEEMADGDTGEEKDKKDKKDKPKDEFAA